MRFSHHADCLVTEVITIVTIANPTFIVGSVAIATSAINFALIVMVCIPTTLANVLTLNFIITKITIAITTVATGIITTAAMVLRVVQKSKVPLPCLKVSCLVNLLWITPTSKETIEKVIRTIF